VNPIWLMRMARWVRRPPSWRRVILVLSVIAACFALFAIERFVGWPDWLTVNGRVRPPR